MKLIVGLGNPGREYENTKHNVGFMFIDYFCQKNNIELKELKFSGIYSKIKMNGEEIIIAKPLTYMNLSGEFVSKIMNFFKINYEDLIVIHDDLDCEIGKIKIKQKGSSGGQNGLRNIISHLKTENIKRIKIGIGRPKNNINIKDYVLSKLTFEEKNAIFSNFNNICEIIEDFTQNNLIKAMNKFN